MILQSSFHQKLWNPEYFSILWSGIDSFEWEKEYYSTSSIQWTNIIAPEEIITYENRPSRANMQPIIWAVWFAKMAKTLKVIKIDEEFAEKSIFSTWFALIYGNPDSIDSGYLKYFFLSSDFNSQKDRLSTGTTQVAINQKGIEKIEIPLFDIETQQLIVSEIEKQFSRLDEWLSSLLRIRQNLKSYRASLLKSAIEWRLTEEWRKENPDIESAEKLLDRIRIARREKWLSENPGKKYKEIENNEELNIIDLPILWIKTTVGFISDSISTWPFGTMLHKSDYINNWIPLINPANIVDWKIVPNYRNSIDNKTAKRLDTYILKEWDIVIWRRWEMGRCAMITNIENWWLCGTGSFFMRLNKFIDRRFFMVFFTSNPSLQYLNRNSIGTTMNNLNNKIMTIMPINLPPLAEQHRIVEILEEKFSVIDALESLVNANIRRAENLKQAILKKAFSGELVWENH